MLDLEPIKERLVSLDSHGPAVYLSARNAFNRSAPDDVAALVAEVERLTAVLQYISSREPIPAACYQIADEALGIKPE